VGGPWRATADLVCGCVFNELYRSSFAGFLVLQPWQTYPERKLPSQWLIYHLLKVTVYINCRPGRFLKQALHNFNQWQRFLINLKRPPPPILDPCPLKVAPVFRVTVTGKLGHGIAWLCVLSLREQLYTKRTPGKTERDADNVNVERSTRNRLLHDCALMVAIFGPPPHCFSPSLSAVATGTGVLLK